MAQPMNVFFIFTLIVISITSSSSSDDHQAYIVHMDKSMMPSPFSNHHHWYTSVLSSLSDEAPATHLYTYYHVMDGFSAVLTVSQLKQLQKMPAHLATFEEMLGQLHTTRTPTFLGLKKEAGLWPVSGFGEDMIIGIIDSGIWPESKSFHDDGMSEAPSRWRGKCEAKGFCNKKLIGARSFSQGMKHLKVKISQPDDYDSPRDFDGHGTHTSSTAAGSRVQFANYFGYANGTATGIAPKAQLAMYKVLFFNDSSEEAAATDTLAGMDQAIEDGVDLMSLSLGFTETPFYQNPIAIGAFAAMEKGIIVSCAAGNSGPRAYTVDNAAPWITTVGAGTVDRDFAAYVTPGDQSYGTLIGKSVFPKNLLVEKVHMYYGYGNRSKESCAYKSLDPKDVKGKYIFCEIDDAHSLYEFTELETMGAAGAIISSDLSNYLYSDYFTFPFVVLERKLGKLLKKYIINTKNASINVKYGETLLGVKPAPQVADFSSRGPSRRSPWILKPDILAPGVDILAAWAPNRESAQIGDDYLFSDFKLDSGTSMACPHVVGIAALLKSTHRDWSPAAIRSAMMTTADILDNNKDIIIDMIASKPGTSLDYGAGHVNPNKAMDPGLVYDIQPQDYINYLCAMGYTPNEIRIISKKPEVNWMSSCSYRAEVNTPPTGMNVVVKPSMIFFEGKYSTAKFEVIVDVDISGATRIKGGYFGNSAYLSWLEVNGHHVVRSPIVSAIAA
ncbi:putative tripeptidyl-peptidase II [Helianthus debilis subsp. tardiflorus]